MAFQPEWTLGPYTIVGQVGRGGMATVYKAYHAAVDRHVAIKVMSRDLAQNPEFSERFHQEARTIAKLEHPRILPLYDYGEIADTTYLVMRFLDTGTLRDRIASTPLSLPEVDRIFTQTADALGYAHANKVVHRDVKPSNILLDRRGNALLTDFGIAKLLESTSHLTSTGAMIGTPAYMSPEQVLGQKSDPRSDLYSLGIVLYEMVTGRVPFEAETPLAVAIKHVNEPLPPPSAIKPGVSPAIERVIQQALAKKPDDRFPSAAEFIAAWQAAMREDAGRAAAARPTRATTADLPGAGALDAKTPVLPTTPATRRRPSPVLWIGGLVAAIALAVGGLLAVGSLGAINSPTQAIASGEVPGVETGRDAATATSSPTSTSTSTPSATPRPSPTKTLRPTTTPTSTPTSTSTPASSPSTTPTPGPTNTPRATNTATPPPIPSGGRILFTTDLGGLFIYAVDPAGGPVTEIGRTDAANSTCSGGSRVATVDGPSFNTYRGPFCPLARLAECQSPNGQWQAVYSAKGRSDGTGSINVGPVDGPTTRFIFDGRVNAERGIRWSPDSSRFIFYVDNDYFVAAPFNDGFQPLGSGRILSWSPDSSMLLLEYPNEVGIQRMDRTPPQFLIQGRFLGSVQCPVWRSN